MNIEDKNLAIAKFVKFRIGNALKVLEGYADYCGKHDLNFHCCWDSLNLAVEKIEKKGFVFFTTYGNGGWICSIYIRKAGDARFGESVAHCHAKTKLGAMHQCVCDFISIKRQKWMKEKLKK